MNNRNRILVAVLAVVFLAALPSCAKVGSERWCEKMKEKPAGDWTPSETKDYAKHCVFNDSD